MKYADRLTLDVCLSNCGSHLFPMHLTVETEGLLPFFARKRTTTEPIQDVNSDIASFSLIASTIIIIEKE